MIPDKSPFRRRIPLRSPTAMGKHNGKARKARGGAASVGASLVNRARRDGRNGSAAAYLYTTEPGVSNNMQSVIESNDLEEMMAMVSRSGD
jgi:hypothetical protein